MFSTMLVIGATVVTTFNFFSAVARGFSSSRLHAAKRSTLAKASHAIMFPGFIEHSINVLLFLNLPKIAVLTACKKHFSAVKPIEYYE